MKESSAGGFMNNIPGSHWNGRINQLREEHKNKQIDCPQKSGDLFESQIF